jgi:hypothetical protein
MRRLNGIGWNVFHRIPLHWFFTNSHNRTKIFTFSFHHLPSIQTRIELLATKLLGPKKRKQMQKNIRTYELIYSSMILTNNLLLSHFKSISQAQIP